MDEQRRNEIAWLIDMCQASSKAGGGFGFNLGGSSLNDVITDAAAKYHDLSERLKFVESKLKKVLGEKSPTLHELQLYVHELGSRVVEYGKI